ncbi:MAG: hypothetical protein IJK23_00915 [Clostridia bacterium]|nr:hypothetical protein [Clostridia bacterium]
MKKIIMTVSGVLTAAICLVMNLVLIPRIEAGTNGIRCFDMNFAYDFETVKQFLALLSEDGRRVYLNIQLPLDFFYPIAYGVFFCLVLYSLSNGRKALLAFPILLAAFDYAENICVLCLLKASQPSQTLATAASAATTAKTVLMYVTILMILVFLVRYLRQHRTNTNARLA